MKVPFYKNTKDDTHCYQAALKMVLAYFLPDRNFSFTQLDEISGKIKNKWTWPQAGLKYLSDMGFEVIIIDKFDYEIYSNNTNI